MASLSATAIDWSGVSAEPSWLASALQGAVDVERDAVGARLASYFLHRGIPAPEVVEILGATFGPHSRPPVSREAIATLVEAVVTREAIRGTVERDVTPEPIGDVLKRVVAYLSSDAAPVVCGTPFPTLNWMLNGGFSPGELIYLGARPGIGKTALALDFARRAGGRGPVVIVSREMLNDQLATRMIAQEGRVPAASLKTKKIAQSDYAKIVNAAGSLESRAIWMTHQAISVGEIADVMRHSTAGEPWSLVIVDYLQLVRAPKDVKDRRLQVEFVSHSLKTLATQHQVPVLCLSSLSRPPHGNPEPSLASLRESGELEHDADVVLLLHKPDETQDRVVCRVAKARSGALGTVDLIFRPQYVTFDELAKEGEPREWTD